MVSIKLSLSVFIVFLLGTGCQVNSVTTPAIPPTRPVTTSTLPSTATIIPSEGTPLPPLQQPTTAPIEGRTATQVNVRAEPSTVSSVLGMIPPDTRVDILGKDPGGNWWQILYPQGADGKGWVTAQYVTTADPGAVPVIGRGSDPNSGNVAVVQQQINVRSGPGTSFNSLGTLNAQDVVSLLGKDSHGTWLQIAFAAGPEGKGWINAGFVQAQGAENLPIVSEAGQVVGTGTPTGVPASPTATLVPAPLDNDSAENPIVSVTFAPSGTQTLIYNGDVSAPAGDTEDWVRFVPFNRQVLVEISCSGSDLVIDLVQSNQVLEATSTCGSQQLIPVTPDAPVQVHVQSPVEASQTYSSYTIKVKSIP